MFVLQTILFVIMISDSLSSYSSDNQRIIPYLKSVEIKVHNQIGDHAYFWPRNFKLVDECVYSLIPLLLLKLSAREYIAPGSAREYLDPVGNKGSHSKKILTLSSANPSATSQRKSKGAKIRPLLLMRRPTILLLPKLLNQ